jgi:hypothetical protein
LDFLLRVATLLRDDVATEEEDDEEEDDEEDTMPLFAKRRECSCFKRA